MFLLITYVITKVIEINNLPQPQTERVLPDIAF